MRNALMLTFNIHVCVHIHTTPRHVSTHAPHLPRSCKLKLASYSKLRSLINIYFSTNSSESIILPELLLNLQNLRLIKNPSLSFLFIESSSGTVERGSGKQITFEQAFSAKSTYCKCAKHPISMGYNTYCR